MKKWKGDVTSVILKRPCNSNGELKEDKASQSDNTNSDGKSTKVQGLECAVHKE